MQYNVFNKCVIISDLNLKPFKKNLAELNLIFTKLGAISGYSFQSFLRKAQKDLHFYPGRGSI